MREKHGATESESNSDRGKRTRNGSRWPLHARCQSFRGRQYERGEKEARRIEERDGVGRLRNPDEVIRVGWRDRLTQHQTRGTGTERQVRKDGVCWIQS